jgi:hypothetical protein
MNEDLFKLVADKLNRQSEHTLDPVGYAQDVLNIELWAGGQGGTGQAEIAQAYANAIDLQLRRHGGEAIGDSDIKNWIRVESGHGVGKTALAAVLATHFFDHFDPAIILCYAPRYEQVNDHLFKDIRTFRTRNPLIVGEALERKPEVKHKPNHYIKGKATKGANTEAAQGAHEQYMMFILDEAEGIDDYVFDAVASMASGGIVTIVLMLANPRTRSSRFYRLRDHPNVVNFTVSCFDHPNVVANSNVIPGAVRRDYVESMAQEYCAEVGEHDPDRYTFELPWKPGVIYAPGNEFMFRVLGVPPSDATDDTFCPVGRYKSIFSRKLVDEELGDMQVATIGVDAARYGDDNGTIYVRRGNSVKLVTEIKQQDGFAYYMAIKKLVEDLATDNVTRVDIRVDGGGGYGSTAIDNLSRETWENDDGEPLCGFDENGEALPIVTVREVLFNAIPYDPTMFADEATELYYHAAQACYVIQADGKLPDSLLDDVCFRTYRYVTKAGRHVRRITSKEQFRKEFRRSPDHGDGFALCVAPLYLFEVDVQIGFA